MPTVTDRFLQQALSQVLTPVFEPSFSDRSFGFRPGRSAHQAVEAARAAIEAGGTWVVDVDLDRFFDRVQHDALMARVARRVGDRRVLRLVRRYLDAGVMVAGVKVATAEGTPQGSPLSPLLANIMLDDLDHELERRGHTFVRYADDLRVYVASERAATRVLVGVTAVVEERLKLKVNQGKSGIAPATVRGLLGFGFVRTTGRVRIRLERKTRLRLKARLRQLTDRHRSIAMPVRLALLNRFLGGWAADFALAETPSVFDELDEWLRHRSEPKRRSATPEPIGRYDQFVPHGVVTRIPEVPSGVVAVMDVSLATVFEVASTPPNLTLVAPVKYWPEMVTVVPGGGTGSQVVGLTELTIGAGQSWMR